MDKQENRNWTWMPHPAHLIVSDRCRFHLATEVGGYIVSTVGEYVPTMSTMKTYAEHRGVELEGRGDSLVNNFINKCGYEEVGHGRTYETMVFESEEADRECCPYDAVVSESVDSRGYNDADEATKGHYELCNKWSGRTDEPYKVSDCCGAEVKEELTITGKRKTCKSCGEPCEAVESKGVNKERVKEIIQEGKELRDDKPDPIEPIAKDYNNLESKWDFIEALEEKQLEIINWINN